MCIRDSVHTVLLDPTKAALVPVAAPAAVPVNQVMDVAFTPIQPLAANVDVAFSNPPSLAVISGICAHACRAVPKQHAIITIALDKRSTDLLMVRRVGLVKGYIGWEEDTLSRKLCKVSGCG